MRVCPVVHEVFGMSQLASMKMRPTKVQVVETTNRQFLLVIRASLLITIALLSVPYFAGLTDWRVMLAGGVPAFLWIFRNLAWFYLELESRNLKAANIVGVLLILAVLSANAVVVLERYSGVGLMAHRPVLGTSTLTGSAHEPITPDPAIASHVRPHPAIPGEVRSAMASALADAYAATSSREQAMHAAVLLDRLGDPSYAAVACSGYAAKDDVACLGLDDQVLPARNGAQRNQLGSDDARHLSSELDRAVSATKGHGSLGAALLPLIDEVRLLDSPEDRIVIISRLADRLTSEER